MISLPCRGDGHFRVLALTQQGKPKAPAPLHTSPYPYSSIFFRLNVFPADYRPFIVYLFIFGKIWYSIYVVSLPPVWWHA